MTVKELHERTGWTLLTEPVDPDAPVGGVYCCDLLSLVMGRAPSSSAWVTVVANLNTIAVAILAELSCVVIAESMTPDPQMLDRARQQGVAVLTSGLPVFETALAIQKAINEQ